MANALLRSILVSASGLLPLSTPQAKLGPQLAAVPTMGWISCGSYGLTISEA